MNNERIPSLLLYRFRTHTDLSLLVMQGIINAMTVSGLSGVMRRTTQYQLRSLMLGLGVEWFHCPAVGSE